MLKNVLFVFATLLAFSVADIWNPCKGTSVATISKVIIGNCKASPCPISDGKPVSAEVYFTPKEDAKDLQASITAPASGSCNFKGVYSSKICKHVATPQGDGQKTAASCDLKKGKEYIIEDKIKCKDCKDSANKDVTLTYEVKAGDKTLFCFESKFNIKE